MSRTVFLLVLLSTVVSMDTPAVEWVKVYSLGSSTTKFGFVSEASDGGFFITTTQTDAEPEYAVYKLNNLGEIEWAGRSNLDNQLGTKALELASRELIVVGFGRETPSTSTELLISKYDSLGTEIWTRLYDSQHYGSEIAFGVTSLPDGGYAICGRISPSEGKAKAWILRADFQGDTLWTREWGYSGSASAVDLIYHENSLLVFIQGSTPTTPGGPHLVRYDMDGNLQWEVGIPDWPGTVAPIAQAMCEASDDGLLLMDHYWPAIVHTDYLGNPDWTIWPPGADQPYGYSLSTTMDGGILYGGEIKGEMGSKNICGVIARFDSLGNDLWYDNIYEESCEAIYSATQLSQGGYIAAGYAYSASAGNQGFLIKYAPETGISSPDPSTVLSLEASPNPCSSSLSVSFSLAETGIASVRIFDLSGKLISTVADGEFPSGSNTVEWSVPEDISSGCYFIQYNSDMGSCIESVVLIN
ncbi:MAG TPA: T9SS type A sorting domain-containing protein [Candidatus Sabulitectum sp.]|nr:T9SS type A sorting domain-containing protein [Candidatus Sabulitectum sp.]